LALVFIEGAQSFLAIEGRMLVICILSGISNAAFLVCWMLAIRMNAMVSVDVGLTLGSLLPSVLCLILFSEPMSPLKMIGFALIVAATFILGCGDHRADKKSIVGVVYLLLAALGDGMSGFAQQLYKQYYTDAGSLTGDVLYPKTIYHFYTYVFAALALLIAIAAYLAVSKSRSAVPRADSDDKKERQCIVLPPRAVLHIFIMAACLFAANYLQTAATNDYGMSSQMLYPIIKGGCLVTVNFTAMMFFGEPIPAEALQAH